MFSERQRGSGRASEDPQAAGRRCGFPFGVDFPQCSLGINLPARVSFGLGLSLNSARFRQSGNISAPGPPQVGPSRVIPPCLQQLCDEISPRLICPPISFIRSDNGSWKRPKPAPRTAPRPPPQRAPHKPNVRDAVAIPRRNRLLICGMRAAILTPRLLAGNSSTAELTPRHQPGAARPGRRKRHSGEKGDSPDDEPAPLFHSHVFASFHVGSASLYLLPRLRQFRFGICFKARRGKQRSRPDLIVTARHLVTDAG